jgi:hypothetical protein
MTDGNFREAQIWHFQNGCWQPLLGFKRICPKLSALEILLMLGLMFIGAQLPFLWSKLELVFIMCHMHTTSFIRLALERCIRATSHVCPPFYPLLKTTLASGMRTSLAPLLQAAGSSFCNRPAVSGATCVLHIMCAAFVTASAMAYGASPITLRCHSSK